MSENVLMDAVKKIEEDIDTLLAEVKKKKQAINVLYESWGEQPPYKIEGETRTGQNIRADIFYGKSFASAAAEYLEMRKQACSANEIMGGLEKGGFVFPWKPKDRLRNVAISLSKNSQTFEKLPNNTFGLESFYPTKVVATSTVKRKRRTVKKAIDPATETGNSSSKKEE